MLDQDRNVELAPLQLHVVIAEVAVAGPVEVRQFLVRRVLRVRVVESVPLVVRDELLEELA